MQWYNPIINLLFFKLEYKILTDIAIIGGQDPANYEEDYHKHELYEIMILKNVEVIKILNGSISYINKTIPSLPHPMDRLSGAWLSNGDLLLCGGLNVMRYNTEMNNQYLLFQEGSSQWNKIGKMKKPRCDHSSVFIDGRLYTCGGCTSARSTTSHLEAFSLVIGSNKKEFFVGVNKKKEMPLALRNHSATKIGQHKMLICGGLDKHVIKNLFQASKINKILRFLF